jgi:hypothetical protein
MSDPWISEDNWKIIIEQQTLSREEMRKALVLDDFPQRILRGPGAQGDMYAGAPTGGSYNLSTLTSPEPVRAASPAAPTNTIPGRQVAEPFEDPGADTRVLNYRMAYMEEALSPDSLEALYREIMSESDSAAEALPDTLVGTGISGCLAVPELARRLGLNWALVRKPNDASHSPWPVEGRIGKRWLFVDDLISTGRTFARIWDVLDDIREDRNFPTQFVGMFLYNDHRFVDPRSRRVSTSVHRYSKRAGTA